MYCDKQINASLANPRIERIAEVRSKTSGLFSKEKHGESVWRFIPRVLPCRFVVYDERTS